MSTWQKFITYLSELQSVRKKIERKAKVSGWHDELAGLNYAFHNLYA